MNYDVFKQGQKCFCETEPQASSYKGYLKDRVCLKRNAVQKVFSIGTPNREPHLPLVMDILPENYYVLSNGPSVISQHMPAPTPKPVTLSTMYMPSDHAIQFLTWVGESILGQDPNRIMEGISDPWWECYNHQPRSLPR